MRMFAVLLDVICTFQEGFWLFMIVDTLFERRGRRSRFSGRMVLGINILCYMILILTLNGIQLVSAYTVIIAWAECSILAYFFWRDHILSMMAVAGAYFFGIYVVSSVEISITGIVGGDVLLRETLMRQGGTRAVYLLICGSIWLCINLILSKCLRKRRINKGNIKYVLCISTAGLVSGLFIVERLLTNFNFRINVMVYIFLFSSIVCVYAIYFWVNRKELQTRLQVMYTQNDMLMRSYEQVNDFYNENAKLYHDMNKHLDMLYYMLEKGEKEKAKQYIESLKKPLHVPVITIRTGIDMIDVIFCEMERKAKEKGVQLTISAQRLPGNITIERKDLCALFVNLLENAVEAAEKEISVQVSAVHQMMLLQVKNDYQNKPMKVNGHFKSTKNDSAHHGWGTQIVEQIVNKYEGSMEYHIKENLFCVDIMLNIQL